MIPKSFIQDLLNRLDIVDVIERYVPLKKAGANYSACCPFHNEKSPSFTVSQTKQFYHCFGCGVHGTAISFVMEHLGLGYVDAIEELARSVGLDVPHERSSAGEVHQKVAPDLYEVMQTATRYYREQLKLSPRAIDYLKQRGLNGEIAAKFGIGYAPDAWQNLAAAFSNYTDETLNETGLVVSNDEGKRYDRFRDRIMFPIINVRGQVIGFGGRVLDKSEYPQGVRREVTGTSGSTSAQPKYLNSPETPLFEKGHELYGLFQAQKSIRAEQRVLVVEGYMDVVALAQLGVEYAVATLGTATTPYHIQKLLRLTEHIVFSFDGDKAGQKAAWRALENALPYLQDGKKISFLFLPAEHDPDSFIREFGKAEFEKRVNEAMPLSAYLLREISADLDLKIPEGRDQLLQRAKPLLTAIVAPITALLLRKEIFGKAGVSEAELKGSYELKPVGRSPRPTMSKTSRTHISPQRTLLRCLIAQPSLAAQLKEAWYGEGLESEVIAALLPVLRDSDFEMSSAALMQYFQGSTYEKLLALEQVGIMEWGEGFEVENYFLDALKKLQTNQEPQQRQEFENRLANKSVREMNAAEREEYMRLLRRN